MKRSQLKCPKGRRGSPRGGGGAQRKLCLMLASPALFASVAKGEREAVSPPATVRGAAESGFVAN